MDYYWERLTVGGDPKAQQCGWLKDRYAVSWQVVPRAIAEMMKQSGERADRVMTALLQMKKLDIATLKAAYER